MISDHPGGGAATPPVDGERITGTSHGDPHQQPIDGDACVAQRRSAPEDAASSRPSEDVAYVVGSCPGLYRRC